MGETSHALPAPDAPACPVCGGAMWDNRITKRNPRAPDFKCRDRSCTGVIWRYKGPEHHASVGETRGRAPEPIGPVVARVLGSIGVDAASSAPASAAETGPDYDSRPSPTAHRADGTPPRAGTRALYRSTAQYIGRRILPLCTSLGITVTADAFAAMVATLFVARRDDEAHAAAASERGRAHA